ncbi:MAG: Na(+)-translocating NADH-quinone reductase subunit A [Spirochaetia bacterium]|nr:Na(+)-translocating NADH-quinone reductase subunit A [Spirochaetia bacterium]
MKVHKIKRGYTVPVKGSPEPNILSSSKPETAGICPVEFKGVKPRLNVKVNDSVKIGSILFHDKKSPELKFASPVCGTVSEIVYGPRRIIEKIRIKPSGEDCEQHPNYRHQEISSIKREQLIDHLLTGGIWPLIRQRPFNTIADPHDQPSSIFVNCMDTAPLAADPEFYLKDSIPEFQAGIEALKILSSNINVIVNAGVKSSIFANIEGIQNYGFSGKHPAGLVGTHIAKIDPVSLQKKVWYLNAGDVVKLGSFLLVGQYPSEQIIAVSGAGIKKPAYIKITSGSQISNILQDHLKDGELRIISGNILTGTKKNPDSYMGFYDNMITVIPEGRDRKFIGWMLPGFNRYTYSRAYASRIFLGKKYDMTTNQNGEPRAFVKTGDYEKVMGIDVYPDHIAKAVISGDIEMMESLGILECSQEDVALCSYICPSKIEFTEIFEKGLDLIRKEIE